MINKSVFSLTAGLSLLALVLAMPVAAKSIPPTQPRIAYAEPTEAIPMTYRLTQSSSPYSFWTTPPSEKVFKDAPLPTTTGSEVTVYAAKNEFEPFQVVVKPAISGNVTVSIGDFAPGVSVELFQVQYVNVDTPTDYLGRSGPNPDPLWPLENHATVPLTAGENTAFWFSVFVARTVPSGDYTTQVTLAGTAIPVRLHVFNFTLPDELHVDSYVDIDFNTIDAKYAAAGSDANRWDDRDRINQFLIDHRVTPRRPMPPGWTDQQRRSAVH